MADQQELDLPASPSRARDGAAARRNDVFAGFTRVQIAAGVLALILLVWAVWVTKALVSPRQDNIVAARLSGLVGDYVEAQRFSGSPPERVKAEMQAFMASLDKELQRRSADGQMVLVGEAVLTKNVPDITESIKKAVYASGVPEPKRASIEDLQRMQQQLGAVGASQAPPPTVLQQPMGPTALIDPMSAAQALPPAAAGQGAAPTQYHQPQASVSTFGGPGGDGNQ